jgi:predicted ATPase/DNA-binding CsgD family transcriptional regulator
MTPGWQDDLTAREAEVLAGIRRHLTNAQLAEELSISIRTVESHVTSILRKSGTADRRGLAQAAEAVDARPDFGSGVHTYDTTFVGRDDLVELVGSSLGAGQVLSLVGPGGVGKTRLAHEVASRLSPDEWDGLVVVDLMATSPGQVAQVVASALRLREQRGVALPELVVAAIGTQRVGLVIDNAEHLVAEVAALARRVTERCPRATVVVTSRERLQVAREQVVDVPPLDGARMSDAVRLFLDRTGLAESDPVADLVAGLGGIPLSIELAAARVPALGLDAVRDAMTSQLDLLAGARGSDPRHRSARDTVAWSHRLLAGEEQELLRALGQVTHPVDLATAAALSGMAEAGTAVLLGRLTDKSMLQLHAAGDGHRWAMLELVRQYTQEESAGDDRADVRRARLRSWAAERASREALAPPVSSARLLLDLLSAAREASGTADEGDHRLARAVATLCIDEGWLGDAVECLGVAAVCATSPREAVDALLDGAAVASARDVGVTALVMCLRAVEVATDADDPILRARALSTYVITYHRYPPSTVVGALPAPDDLLDEASGIDVDDPVTRALQETARAWSQGDADQAERAVAAAESTADPTLIADALDALITAYGDAHRLRQARAAAERLWSMLLATAAASPRAVQELVDVRHVTARTALVLGWLDAAEQVDRGPGSPVTPDAVQDLPRQVRVHALRGRFGEAIGTADLMWDRWAASGAPPRAWMSTAAAAAVLACGMSGSTREGEWRRRTLTLADAAVPDDEPVLAAIAAYVDARLALHRHDLADAARFVSRCSATFTDRWSEGFARCAGVELAIVAGLPGAAQSVAGLDPYAEESDWAAAVRLRCLARLHPESEDAVASARLWQRIGAEAELAATRALLTARS